MTGARPWLLIACCSFGGCLFFDNPQSRPLTTGPSGDTGETGDMGETGDTGDTGNTGSMSAKVGGTVSGLRGSLGLRLNGSEVLTLTTDGSFQFTTVLQPTSAYAVDVSAQPQCPYQACTVAQGSGVAGTTDVSDVAVTCVTTSPPPRVFFTDLLSLPRNGSEGGAYVRIYGENFGATRGAAKVEVGGVEVANYLEWGEDLGARGLDRITVQIATTTPLGPQNLVLTAADGRTSTWPLRITNYRILFVSPTGGGDGTTSANPQTLNGLIPTLVAGDVVYLRGGNYTAASTHCDVVGDVREDAVLCLPAGVNGDSDTPIAFAGYPLDFSPARPGTGALDAAVALENGYIVLSELSFVSGILGSVLGRGDGMRLVGLKADTLPVTAYAQVHWFGGTFDGGRVLASRLAGAHAIEMRTGSDLEIAYNELGGRIEIAGDDNYGVEPNGVLIRYNLFDAVDVHTHPDTPWPLDIAIEQNIFNGCPDTAVFIETPTDVLVSRNLFFRNSDVQVGVNGSTGANVTMRHNIVVNNVAGSYVSFGASMNTLERNLWMGGGPAPASDTTAIATPATFVNWPMDDFRPGSDSGAIDQGPSGVTAPDFFGEVPRGAAPDLGPIEYCAP